MAWYNEPQNQTVAPKDAGPNYAFSGLTMLDNSQPGIYGSAMFADANGMPYLGLYAGPGRDPDPFDSEGNPNPQANSGKVYANANLYQYALNDDGTVKFTAANREDANTVTGKMYGYWDDPATGGRYYLTDPSAGSTYQHTQAPKAQSGGGGFFGDIVSSFGDFLNDLGPIGTIAAIAAAAYTGGASLGALGAEGVGALTAGEMAGAGALGAGEMAAYGAFGDTIAAGAAAADLAGVAGAAGGAAAYGAGLGDAAGAGLGEELAGATGTSGMGSAAATVGDASEAALLGKSPGFSFSDVLQSAAKNAAVNSASQLVRTGEIDPTKALIAGVAGGAMSMAPTIDTGLPSYVNAGLVSAGTTALSGGDLQQSLTSGLIGGAGSALTTELANNADLGLSREAASAISSGAQALATGQDPLLAAAGSYGGSMLGNFIDGNPLTNDTNIPDSSTLNTAPLIGAGVTTALSPEQNAQTPVVAPVVTPAPSPTGTASNNYDFAGWSLGDIGLSDLTYRPAARTPLPIIGRT